MSLINKKSESGFTLVELAIALMIIGLLIGGVLKGIELVENARVTQVMRGVKAYETAVTAFQSIYVALPGDINNPGTRLPGCSAAPCNLAGNANGIVGTQNTTGVEAPTGAGEERRFWLHLAVTGLISGINVNDTTTTPADPVVWGVNFPASPVVGAGFMLQNVKMVGSGSYSGRFSGHYVNLRGATSTDGVLTGNQSLQMDTKFDDGTPGSGDIFVSSGTIANCASSGNYVVDSDDKVCSLYFKTFK